MSADRRSKRPKGPVATILKKLLGDLEREVMECMWPAKEATVRQVVKVITRRRPIAYTTIMTVMGHLVDKGLLTRTMEGERYRYRVSRSREEFLHEASQRLVRSLVDDFGDLAIAGFMGEISKVDTDRLEQLKRLAQEVSGESNVSD